MDQPRKKDGFHFDQVRLRLCYDFPRFYNADICRVLNFFSGDYWKTHAALQMGLDKLKETCLDKDDLVSKSCTTSVTLNLTNEKNQQLVFQPHWMKIKRYQMNVAHFSTPKREESSKENKSVGKMAPVKTLVGESHAIECACCFGEFGFEKLAQCGDGHLVCRECLEGYTKQQIYGLAKFHLLCMAEDCTSSYSRGELERCLPREVVEKWDERIQEENLKMCNLELSRCPYCHFACVLSPTVSVLHCKRETCSKLTCKKCGVDWYEHEGKSCSEVKEMDETAFRKEYEEKMTQAMVRTCPKCKAQFFKEEGCNKMMCQCGMTMCYVCQKTKIDYDHFCTHRHDTPKGCTSCNKCYLWANTKKYDEGKISNLKREAILKQKSLGYREVKPIGAPPEKKQRPC